MTESAGWLDRIRKQIQKNRYSKNPLVKGSTLLVRSPWYVWQFATDGFYRTTILNRFRNPDSLHLTCNYTKMDRYPEIFALVKKHFEEQGKADSPELKILSFGCSTGEEAFSLRGYFPKAEIVGVDISEWNLKQARKKNEDDNIRFLFSDQETLEENGPYDAIFCMAVLLRIAHRMEPAPSSAEEYPIDKFIEQISGLDELLNPGGALIVCHTNYHLRDTPISERYRVLPFDFTEIDLIPKYGKDNQLLPESDTKERVFVKERSA